MEKNADAYEPALADSYYNVGDVCDDNLQLNKAKKYYLAAIEIYKQLVFKTGNEYEEDFAVTYNNIANIYKVLCQFGKAKKYYLAAIERYERLVKKNADVYEPELATLYYNYYLLKKDKTYLIKAYEIAKRRQDDPRCRDIVEFAESHKASLFFGKPRKRERLRRFFRPRNKKR